MFSKPIAENGFNQPAELLLTRHLVRRTGEEPERKVPDSPPTPLAAERFEMEMEGNKPTLAAAQSEAPPPLGVASAFGSPAAGSGSRPCTFPINGSSAPLRS